MTRKTADDFLHTNQEYEKLKSEQADGTENTPREKPSGQAPGRMGYSREMFDEWTREELQRHAETLEIAGAADMSRDALIDAIGSRDATLASRS